MYQYFEELAADMSALGMDGLATPEPETYQHAYDLMCVIARRLKRPGELVIDTNYLPSTYLGKTIVRLLEDRGHYR